MGEHNYNWNQHTYTKAIVDACPKGTKQPSHAGFDLLSYICYFIKNENCETLNYQDQLWYYLSSKFLRKQLKQLGITNNRSIDYQMNKLISDDWLVKYPNGQKENRTYYAKGKLFLTMEKNLQRLEENLQGGSKNPFKVRCENSYNNNSTRNNNTIDNVPRDINFESLKNRKEDFVKILEPHIPAYGKEMIRDFFDYWTERSPNDHQMRFEKEKAFDVNVRLKRWKDNSKEDESQTKPKVTWG